MKMTSLLIGCLLVGATVSVSAQTTATTFQGAEATKARYKVVYQLNSDDESKIKGTLKNIQNAIADPRLAGKLDVELVVHGSGVAVFQKDKPYEAMVQALQGKGVILAMCENTMRERKISRDSLFPFVSYVPSGNGELIIRQQEGWAFMHP
ncbi:DsrE family protein [Fibrella aquatica]|uniref:DsrE family protein n=1 Tax=Fibrella aquatica TaxID=3242487 RepID=UPI003520DD35